MSLSNQNLKSQLRQLDRALIIRKSDVISVEATNELIRMGYAIELNDMVFASKEGRRVAKLTYSNKVKWLKDEKKSGKGKGGKLSRRKHGKSSNGKGF